MNRILQIGGDTITVEAGARHIDMARELEKQGLQFYVNTEIGSLTAGSAACAGTKDASFAGEYGQVGSYVIGVKLVLPNGELLEVTEAQPELMQTLRSSYGTFGIVYEVTYRIRRLLPMAVYHETYTLDDFVAKLDALKARGESMMYYCFPFADRITIEFRRYNPTASGDPDRAVWPLRNYLWGTAGPRFGHDIEASIADPKIRYAGDRQLRRRAAVQARKHNPRRLHHSSRPDHRLPRRVGRQPLHVQPVRLRRSAVSYGILGVLHVRARLLRSARIPVEPAVCRLSDCAGPAVAAVVFVRRAGHDD